MNTNNGNECWREIGAGPACLESGEPRQSLVRDTIGDYSEGSCRVIGDIHKLGRAEGVGNLRHIFSWLSDGGVEGGEQFPRLLFFQIS